MKFDTKHTMFKSFLDKLKSLSVPLVVVSLIAFIIGWIYEGEADVFLQGVFTGMVVIVTYAGMKGYDF